MSFPDELFDYILIFFFESPDVPLVVLRPSTADGVAALVGHLSESSIPFMIRVGMMNWWP